MATFRTEIPQLRRNRAGFRLSFVLSLILGVLACCTSSLYADGFKVLHTFQGTQGDGYNPFAIPTVGPNGILYGTTWEGGNLNCIGSYFGQGCGEVYEIVPPTRPGGEWAYAPIYEFTGGNDGGFPISALTLDSSGRLYGVTDTDNDFGQALSLFQLTAVPVPNLPGNQIAFWTYKDLYDFTDGYGPSTPLLIDSAGALYGVGQSSPGYYGAVLQFAPTQNGPWTQNFVHQFTDGSDGSGPNAIVMDSNGTIYGTAVDGGIVTQNCPYGCGTVFQLVPDQGTWSFSVIYSFTGMPDDSPGNLTQDASGNLYGLALNGQPGTGSIEVFELTSQNGIWTETIPYVFNPNLWCGYGPEYLTAAPDGTLFGTTDGDQDFFAGALFQVSPPAAGGKWTLSTLRNFNNSGPDGLPSGVVVGGDGALYGALDGSWGNDGGDVYRVRLGQAQSRIQASKSPLNGCFN